MATPSKSKRDYLYKQLYKTIRKDIQSGKYTKDERLPSMDELSKQYGMNRITVKRALSELRAEELIYSIPAQGTYVSGEKVKPASTTSSRLTVGLVISQLHTHALGSYHVDIITGIQEALIRYGWNLMFVAITETSEDRAYEQVMHVQLDAVIYLGIFEATLLRRLVRNGPPCVLLDLKLRGLRCATVNVDNHAGGYEGAKYLAELGHKRLTVLTGYEGHITDERRQGVLDAWADSGLDVKHITWMPADFQRETGFSLMLNILNNPAPVPTAVFCFNDEMAAGIIQAIHQHGEYLIPSDISVLGFDNISWTLATFPQLSTIQVERFAMGSLAVDRLKTSMDSEEQTPTSTLVSTKLIVRNSTGKSREA